jgi:hypothetical protein
MNNRDMVKLNSGVLLILLLCFMIFLPLYALAGKPDVFISQSTEERALLKKLDKEEGLPAGKYNIKLHISPKTHKVTTVVDSYPLKTDEATLEAGSLWRILKSNDGLSIYHPPVKEHFTKRDGAIVHLPIPEKGISLLDWDGFEIYYYDLNPRQPVALDVLLSIDTDNDGKADVRARSKDYSFKQPRLLKRIDMEKVKYLEKDYRYLLGRILGLKFDEDWRYTQDGEITVLQRRFHYRIKPGQLLRIYMKQGTELHRLYLMVGFKDKPKAEELVLFEELSTRRFQENGRNVLEVNLGGLLEGKYSQKESLYLEEVFLHIKGEAESIVRQGVAQEIHFYQDVSLKEDVSKEVFLTADIEKGTGNLNRLSLDLDALQQRGIYNGRIVGLDLALSSSPQEMSGIGLIEAAFVQRFEVERPVVFDIGRDLQKKFTGYIRSSASMDTEDLPWVEMLWHEPFDIRTVNPYTESNNKEFTINSRRVKFLIEDFQPYSFHYFNVKAADPEDILAKPTAYIRYTLPFFSEWLQKLSAQLKENENQDLYPTVIELYFYMKEVHIPSFFALYKENQLIKLIPLNEVLKDLGNNLRRLDITFEGHNAIISDPENVSAEFLFFLNDEKDLIQHLQRIKQNKLEKPIELKGQLFYYLEKRRKCDINHSKININQWNAHSENSYEIYFLPKAVIVHNIGNKFYLSRKVDINLPIDMLVRCDFESAPEVRAVLELQTPSGNKRITLIPGKPTSLTPIFGAGENIRITHMRLRFIQDGPAEGRYNRDPLNVTLKGLTFLKPTLVKIRDILHAQVIEENQVLPLTPVVKDMNEDCLIGVTVNDVQFLRKGAHPYPKKLKFSLTVNKPARNVEHLIFKYALPDDLLRTNRRPITFSFYLASESAPVVLSPWIEQPGGELRLPLDWIARDIKERNQKLEAIDVVIETSGLTIDERGAFRFSDIRLETGPVILTLQERLKESDLLYLEGNRFRLSDAGEIEWKDFWDNGIWIILPSTLLAKDLPDVHFSKHPYLEVDSILFEGQNLEMEGFGEDLSTTSDERGITKDGSLWSKLTLVAILIAIAAFVFKIYIKRNERVKTAFIHWRNYLLDYVLDIWNMLLRWLHYIGGFIQKIAMKGSSWVLKQKYHINLIFVLSVFIITALLSGKGYWQKNNVFLLIMLLCLILVGIYHHSREYFRKAADSQARIYRWLYGEKDRILSPFLRLSAILVLGLYAWGLGKIVNHDKIPLILYVLFLAVPLYLFLPVACLFLTNSDQKLRAFLKSFIIAGLGVYLYRKELQKDIKGENYFFTIGGLFFVAAYYYFARGIQPFFEKYLRRFSNIVYGSKGSVYIFGFLITLITAAVLLIVKLEPVAKQVAVIGYYMLVAGVAYEAWILVRQKRRQALPGKEDKEVPKDKA